MPSLVLSLVITLLGHIGSACGRGTGGPRGEIAAGLARQAIQ
jgi:hypothetical protein